MRKTAAILATSCFIGVAIFGFAFVSHSAEHATPDCVVSSFIGGNALCPENLIGFVNFHAQTLKGFANVLISFGLILMAAAALVVFPRLFSPPPLRPASFLRELSLASALSKRKFLSFLSLFEHSPSF